jgi:hemerythrin-like domain-containing protein
MIVKYRKKLIRNLGNYENITVEIELEDNVVYERGETYESCYDKLRSSVSKSLSEENKKIDEYLKTRGVK